MAVLRRRRVGLHTACPTLSCYRLPAGLHLKNTFQAGCTGERRSREVAASGAGEVTGQRDSSYSTAPRPLASEAKAEYFLDLSQLGFGAVHRYMTPRRRAGYDKPGVLRSRASTEHTTLTSHGSHRR